MAQSAGRGRVVGDYLVDRQIGSGSFSVVWHAKHRVHGTEVAIKEIATGRLDTKLQDSLKSEICILQRINHPNIIRLHDIIEVPGKIHLVLEYCRGGDLSMHIQHHGKVPEETAKYFMQQLAKGLQVLRKNNLIHRDLKPQNLLLATSDERSILKIADFGFARSLQPRGLAETLCGSPLYMAPEIMQLKKYDAKADLWSIGAILYQLVTGKTPFTGNSHIQLLENIVKSNELHFPPESNDLSFDCKDLCQKLLRRNPVERLTFEEFFNHSFLSQKVPDESSRSRKSSKSIDCYPVSEPDLVKTEDFSHDECFPFILEDEGSGSCGSPSLTRTSLVEFSKGFKHEKDADRQETAANTYNKMDRCSIFRYGSSASVNKAMSMPGIHRPVANQDDPPSSVYQPPMGSHSRVEDSFDLIQDYVIVSGPPMDVSSHSESGSKPSHSKHQNALKTSANIMPPSSASDGVININAHCIGSLDSCGSAPGTSLLSMDLPDVFEKPSTHCMTQIKSLQQCASAIKELVNEKFTAGSRLKAFSMQLVILAIWKRTLDISQTETYSSSDKNQEGHDSGEFSYNLRPEGVSPRIKGEFLRELESAENLAKLIERGCTEMPDAMETIFQSALSLGIRGGVLEMMGDAETAASLYSKAARLLFFLLVEAPSLILNPPFSLTDSDSHRLRKYIKILNSRQGYLRSDAGGASQVRRPAAPRIK